ncbi:MAG TPA: hypothetical protein VHZ03_55495 [Trebonia sp.]|nr:hypothetical protein [Trebonia sp.]
MYPPFQVGERIRKIAGVVEREDENIHARYYSAIIELESVMVAYLAPNAVARLRGVPDDVEGLPVQMPDGERDLTGSAISGSFIHHRPGEDNAGVNGPQLFLVLDHDWLMGMIPTQRGTVLHAEPVLTSPLLRHGDWLVTQDNKPAALDELLGAWEIRVRKTLTKSAESAADRECRGARPNRNLGHRAR